MRRLIDDRALAVALVVAGVGHVLGMRFGMGLWGAMGSDAVLWGLSAKDIAAGASPLVPPLYPALIGALHALGLPLVEAGWGISTLAAGLVLAGIFLASRAAGAGRWTALLAAFFFMGVPELTTWGHQVQPDALAAFGAVALAGLLTAENPRAAWGAAILAGLFPLLREHGLALAGLTGLALLGRRAWGPALLLVVMIALGPALFGQAPWAPSWGERAGGALAALRAHGPEGAPYARELPPAERREYLSLLAEDRRLEQLAWHARRSLGLAPDAWLTLGLAGVGAAMEKRLRPLALPLLAALPALLIWSQRRHVLLLVPVALAVLVALAELRPRLGRALLALATLALALKAAPGWPQATADWKGEIPRARDYAAVAGWLEENAPPNSLLGGLFQDVGLYHPMVRHDPDGSAADWSTFVVADRQPPFPPGQQWSSVWDNGHGLRIWRREPGRSPRPCEGSPPAPGSAYLAIAKAHAELPGCAEP